MAGELVWIRSTVEVGLGDDEDFVAIPLAEWSGMTAFERDRCLVETAVTHQNNVAPCGAEVVDESEVPQEYIDRESGA
jgi:hypothetical protein